MGGAPTQSMQDLKRYGKEQPAQRVGYGVGGEMLFAPAETQNTNSVSSTNTVRDTSASEYEKARMADEAAKKAKEYAPRD
jgi:hypothetical protein